MVLEKGNVLVSCITKINVYKSSTSAYQPVAEVAWGLGPCC